VSQTAPVVVPIQVCDAATPPACSTSLLTLEPVTPPSALTNDAPIALNDATRTTAGVATTVNVLANDRDPEGQPLTNPTLVSLPTNGSAVVNPDGTVTYTPNPGFVGVDGLVYQVCDNGTPVQCNTALVTFTVDPTPPAGVTNTAPNALDDQLLTQKNTPGTGSVATNDSDPQGQPLVFSQLTSPSSGTVVFNPDGSYSYTPAPGYVGTTNFVYQACDNASPALCSTATAYITVSDETGLLLQAKAWLQGALFSVTGVTGVMRDDLRVKGFLPATSPYTNFTALTPTSAISNTATVFGVTGNNAIVDWVFVELRSPSNMSLVVDSRPALIQRDGDIVELDGLMPVGFSQVSAGNYYVVVRHRNHLSVMTATALPLSGTSTVVDFRLPTTATYRASVSPVNEAQVSVAQGVALWAGNVLENNTVIYQGTGNDVAGVSVQVKNNPQNITGAANFVLNGYYNGDINLDGRTIYQGSGNEVNFIFLNVTKNHPGNSAGQNFFIIREQLP
jgi:hypothetical protein